MSNMDCSCLTATWRNWGKGEGEKGGRESGERSRKKRRLTCGGKCKEQFKKHYGRKVGSKQAVSVLYSKHAHTHT